MAYQAAELLKSTHGDLPKAAERSGGTEESGFWRMTGENGLELRAVRTESDEAYLGEALIKVYDKGEALCSLRVCWQEVEPGA